MYLKFNLKLCCSQKLALNLLFSLILVLLYAIDLPQAFAVEDYVTERTYFVDETAKLTLAEAQKCHFKPLKDTYIGGFSTAALWSRVKIDPSKAVALDNATPRAQRMIYLRIKPYYLDHIEVYDPTYSPAPMLGGDREPVNTQIYTSLNQNFSLPLGETARYVWLRVLTQSPIAYSVEAHDLQTVIRQDQVQSLMYAGAFGMQFIFLMITLLLMFTRFSTFGWGDLFQLPLLIAQIILLFFGLTNLGILRLYFLNDVSPILLDMLSCTASVLFTTVGLYVHSILMCTLIKDHFLVRCLWLLIALAPISLALILLDNTRLALMLNAVPLFVGFLICFVIVLKAFIRRGSDKQFPYHFLLIAYAVFIASLIYLAADIYGGYLFSNALFHTFWMTSFSTSMIFLYFISYQERLARQMQSMTQVALIERNTEIQLERAKREEQARFMAMLGHQIKSPLSTLSMSLAMEHTATNTAIAKKTINEISTLIERCMQAEEYSEQHRPRNSDVIQLDVMIKDIMQANGAPRYMLEIAEMPAIVSDAQLVRIVLFNLLENACKYSAENTPIFIGISAGGFNGNAGVLVCVENTAGKYGMPDENSVFEKYYRSPKAKSKLGSGLGLYLVSHLVKLLKGHVEYAPKHQIVSFTLWLPISASS